MTNQKRKQKEVDRKLLFRNISAFILIFALVFIGAGRFYYWQGWLYIGLNVIFILASYFMIPSELTQERLKPGKGTKKWDKIYYIINVPLYFAMIIISALDAGRFGWEPHIPIYVVISAAFVYIVGQIIMLWAKRENKFFSSVVRIQKDREQTVCKEGPYGFVRHPGYLGGIIFTIATPIVLASFWGLIPALLSVVTLFIRTYLEDKTLQEELEGYKEYTNEIKYRIIPGIW
ncbi:MAG: isoprenylcysteine carboxylmethyltransferase family protein [Methanobacterium sp.]|uniref:methyltransferase family protein n=1 Tax=Methanobacterium sp. TaxID=2164 RepID=UPI003D64B712|nr:isoprenylcysteine carboxylmethyltransferase family protein [Methanobacterium sp.]